MNYGVAPARLRDWPAILQLRQEFQDGPAASYIDASEEVLEAYLCNSIVFPERIAFLLLFDDNTDDVVGIAALQLVDHPSITAIGTGVKRYAFIQAVYISPQVSNDAGLVFDQGITLWAQKRGATWLYGNVREGGPLKGFERKYGFSVLHHVIGKEVKYNG